MKPRFFIAILGLVLLFLLGLGGGLLSRFLSTPSQVASPPAALPLTPPNEGTFELAQNRLSASPRPTVAPQRPIATPSPLSLNAPQAAPHAPAVPLGLVAPHQSLSIPMHSHNELEIKPTMPSQNFSAQRPQSVPMRQISPEPRIPSPESQEATREIPLPKVFQGCWEGQVPHLDTMRRIGGPRPAWWITKTYRLCYRRVGDGPFRPTFTDAGLAAGANVSNVIGRLKVLSTDGHSIATLRAYLQFNEPGPLFGMGVGAEVNELTDMHSEIYGDRMHVEARVYSEYDSQPWCVMTWHADFAHSTD